MLTSNHTNCTFLPNQPTNQPPQLTDSHYLKKQKKNHNKEEKQNKKRNEEYNILFALEKEVKKIRKEVT